jgi:glycosyltransferase involved in cell wall biosynthesis
MPAPDGGGTRRAFDGAETLRAFSLLFSPSSFLPLPPCPEKGRQPTPADVADAKNPLKRPTGHWSTTGHTAIKISRMKTEMQTAVPKNRTSQKPLRIVAMEIETGGHHPGYIQNLAKYWTKNELPGELVFLVTPKFLERHRDVVEEVAGYADHHVRLQAFTQAEYKQMESNIVLRYFRGWRLFCKYLRELRADHGVVMYFDFFQLPAWLGKRPPCSFSGIYFRPNFHYPSFANYAPRWQDRMKAFRKKWLLSRVLKNPQLRSLFCLDPYSADFIRAHLKPAGRQVHFPDPVRFYDEDLDINSLGQSLAVESHRRIFLLLGGLDRRKGVTQLLDAAALVPPESAKRICLLLVGPVEAAHREQVYAKVDALHRTSPMQVLLKDAFVVDREVQRFYELSDVVLTTYQHHVGMSSALVRAGAAGKPVLSAQDGLMGELVHRLKLGGTVDSTSPAAMARELTHWSDRDLSAAFDSARARQFALENESQQTGRAFFDEIFAQNSG